jgi:8-oxo-dGTP pyrophosphatase MutT (NUDIX family)
MKLLSTHYHEAVKSLEGRIEERIAARGVILKDKLILLLYTRRYNDYSLPGGGVDAHESIEEGLIRELEEETGAKNIQVEEGMGIYEEYRPARTKYYDILHMTSYIFKVNCDEVFDLPKFELYEVKNDMKAVWIDLDEAIDHNKKVIERLEPSMGLSIRRELFLLETIKQEYLLRTE